jgi:sugar phosphate isomerase/epimerase
MALNGRKFFESKLSDPGAVVAKFGGLGNMNTLSAEKIAVCSWSLQPGDLADLLRKLELTGISRVQLALDPVRENAEAWPNLKPALQQAGITLVSGMFGCVGEDYSTPDSIRRTGGIAPDSTWNENLTRIRAAAELASQLQLKLVTFHAGFLPHDESDPNFSKMLERLSTGAKIFADRHIALGLETGQETAAALASILKKVNAPNLRVNFDPANMLLYDKGDPVEALRRLAPWISQVHVKDARRPRTPETWGEEVPAGTGEVDWPGFFGALKEMNFAGNCVIEREAGSQRVADVQTAKALIERWIS